MKKLAILSLSVLASTASFGALASNFYVQLTEDTDSGLSTIDAVTSMSTPTIKFKARRDSVFNYTLVNKTTGDSTTDSVILPRMISYRLIKFPYLVDGEYEMTYRNSYYGPEVKKMNFVIDSSVDAYKVEHRVSGDEVIFTSKVEPDSLFEVSYHPENRSMEKVGALVTSDSNDGYVSVSLPLINGESNYTVTYKVTDKAGNKKTVTNLLTNL
ncbi:hypothetical protein NDJ00_24295 [Vibrio parahaemolyticus]|uniref:hypothetical protein n=1 Tax=Vibrio TaxID=662 RepID=UPI0006C3A38D|nr:hypothetical protein [Vibrio parahaemolyticus]EJG0766657.1 hypothetical protein [Vibrio parahaemolyticus O5:K30]EGR3229884.1 hypothetical protein [Vibrio parahaemolyticus]EGR5926692.1 hypothetical protein [Vibrio parahaemolyticus]KOY41250.1 hypothetical protein ACX10_02785 [Vibrio parahaemolyticus]MCS0117305.1 hypothetical protein [Vibrio parahaemolyticus]